MFKRPIAKVNDGLEVGIEASLGTVVFKEKIEGGGVQPKKSNMPEKNAKLDKRGNVKAYPIISKSVKIKAVKNSAERKKGDLKYTDFKSKLLNIVIGKSLQIGLSKLYGYVKAKAGIEVDRCTLPYAKGDLEQIDCQSPHS
ncbi:MAG: hypothetical protein LBU32_07325 [Clostridiales bacterium]|jgi:hypothetical protein|nr:hypothetical protein [Clostridiales bacterium]